MAKRKFLVHVEAEVELELDEAVLSAAQTPEFEELLMTFNGDEAVAEHIGYNLIVNSANLSQLDGWADQPDTNAKLGQVEWSVRARGIK